MTTRAGISERDLALIFSVMVLLLGVMAMALLLRVVVRGSRGLVGIVLMGAAVVLLVYWAREAYRTVGQEFDITDVGEEKEWNYEIHREGDEAVLVGEVPGPERELEVRIRGKVLEVRGGQGFVRKVKMPFAVKEWDQSYRNGVLQVVARDRRR
jgi:hypothetical protein